MDIWLKVCIAIVLLSTVSILTLLEFTFALNKILSVTVALISSDTVHGYRCYVATWPETFENFMKNIYYLVAST